MPDSKPEPNLYDELVPELELLTSPAASEVLGAALDAADGTLRQLTISQIRYVPSTSVTVQFRADVTWADGRSTREILVAAAGIDVPPEVPIVEGDGTKVALWRYPNDPFLPGLTTAGNRDRVQHLLEQLGVKTDSVRLRTRAYRPGRRAVVEVKSPQARVFVKVVRPARVASLQRIHTSMTDSIQIPKSLGWSNSEGIVVLQAMPGKTLRKAVEGGTKRLPTAGHLASILDVVPPVESRPVAGARGRAGDHGRLLGAVLPDEAERINDVVAALSAEPVARDDVPVHGDFHASQVLVRNQAILGLIDVDTVGMGLRSHDFGNFLGHLATLGLISPARKNVHRYGAELLETFDQMVDPRQLRLDVAAAVFGLATGPFRVFEKQWPAQTMRRIALAEEWIASAAATT